MTLELAHTQNEGYSFNPCFGGSYIVTNFLKLLKEDGMSFNPCFGGSYIVTEGGPL